MLDVYKLNMALGLAWMMECMSKGQHALYRIVYQSAYSMASYQARPTVCVRSFSRFIYIYIYMYMYDANRKRAIQRDILSVVFNVAGSCMYLHKLVMCVFVCSPPTL